MIDLLITGVHGQLGRALERLARQCGLSVECHDLDTLDVGTPLPWRSWSPTFKHRP